MFLEHLTIASLQNVALRKEGGKKTIMYQDVAAAVRERDELEFLDDIVPDPITVEQLEATRAEYPLLPTSTATEAAGAQPAAASTAGAAAST